MKSLSFLFCFIVAISVQAQNNILVKTINPTGHAYPNNFYAFNGLLYFSANDGVNGTTLWVTDGTAAGTSIIRNAHAAIMPPAKEFFEFQGKLYIKAMNSLWVTDGTTAGTTKVTDATDANRIDWNNKPCIWYRGSFNQIRIIGGSGPGDTLLLKDVLQQSFTPVRILGEHNHQLYFVASDSNGEEVWVSDGTPAGTFMLKDIYPAGNSNAQGFCVYNNEVYFTACSEDKPGFQQMKPWVTDGTVAGTRMLKNIPSTSSFPVHYYTFSNKLCFFQQDFYQRYTFWMTDGTEAGTVMGNTYSNLSDVVVFQNKLFFQADNTVYYNDGTGVTNHELKKIDTKSSPMKCLTVANNKLYFIAKSYNKGGFFETLWESDGTAQGTRQLELLNDKLPYSPLVYTNMMYTYKNDIYLSAVYTGTYQLWKIDMTFPTAVDNGVTQSSKAYCYPNPVASSGMLHFSAPVTGALYDMQGCMVMPFSEITALHLPALLPGLYTIRTSDGEPQMILVK